MKFQSCEVLGAWVIEPQPHIDDRGRFMRIWSGDEFAKRGIDFFEPTECGPLYLNDGAVIIDGETFEPTEPSNSHFVATCLDESDPDCDDADNDGWSVDCGDCDDSDEAINPGAVEICSDEIDNNCDGYINEDCSSPAIPG